jgi:hypothetical protein
MSYDEFLYPFIPPVFALLTIIFSKFENQYFDKQAINLSRIKERPEDDRLFAGIAKSSASFKNHIVTMTSGFLSLVIALGKWPDPWRFYMAAAVILIFLFVFRSWTWKIFSLSLDEISAARMRRKKRAITDPAFQQYTYAELFTKLHLIFNCALMIIIFVGQLHSLKII